MTGRIGRLHAVVLASALAWPVAVRGQTDGPTGARSAALDTVIAVQDMFLEASPWRTQVIVDVSATQQVTNGLFANVRPVFWRVGGRWETLLDQASLRVELDKGARLRIEAGRFPSPIGLGMMENRANMNAGVLWCHRLYYGPLPSLGPQTAPQSLISAVYPVGVMASASTTRWDARVAALDRAPVDLWTAPTRLRAPQNAAAGVGFSPLQGLRVGVASAWGKSETAQRQSGTGGYRLWNAEADWAFGYTRLSGEWTRDRFETATGSRVASGWTAQARHSLSPRWFAHSRATVARAPRVAPDGESADHRFTSVDSTVGYLVSPETTIRAGHAAVRGWGRRSTDHQLGVSVVWARRWW